MLPADIVTLVAAYLRSIRNLYNISIAVDLDPNWRQHIAEFDSLFMFFFRTRVNLGTPAHKRRLHRSSCIYNLKNLGFNMSKHPLPPYLINVENDKERDNEYL